MNKTKRLKLAPDEIRAMRRRIEGRVLPEERPESIRFWKTVDRIEAEAALARRGES